MNHGTYNIIDGDYKTAKEKESLWEISIGLNEVDGLKPSEFLIRLTKDSIEGRNRSLFDGVFQGNMENYVGKFRDFNITKNEAILNGDTVIYGNYKDMMDYMQYDFEVES